VRPRAAPEPEPEPESDPEPEHEAAEAPAAPADDALAGAYWPDEFEERAVADAAGELEAPPEPRAPRRRRQLPRALTRTLLVLVLGGLAAGAYWWFQPEIPLPKWSTLTGVGSTIGAKVSALGGKVAGLVASLRRRAPVPARPTPKPPPVVPPPAASRPAPSGTPATAAAPAPPPRPPPARAKLDQAGDSLTQVVRNFTDRTRQFDRRQLACAGLARGLELVESRWIAYTTARRSAGVLDGARAGRDQALYAGVDSVERRFEQSGCARP